MPKASPSKVNFNGGEFSALMQARSDIDRFPSAMRKVLNMVTAPQGPALKRSGTYFQHTACSDASPSALIPFVFSDEQSNMLEFSNLKMRILSESGILVYSITNITAVVSLTPLVVTSAALVAAGAVIGSQVIFGGFPDVTNMQGVIANVTNVVGNDVTFDVNYTGAAGALTAQASRIVTVVSPYAAADVANIKHVQSLDVIYLFCPGYKIYKMSRNAATNWTITAVQLFDGPYEREIFNSAVLTPSGTGRLLGGVATDGGNNGVGKTGASAFDADQNTYFETSASMTGQLIYTFSAPTAIEGYTIYAARDNTDATNTVQATRPYTWTLEGSNNAGATWFVIDQKTKYSLWDVDRSQYHRINNSIPYTMYRLNFVAGEISGAYKVRVREWVLKSAVAPTLTLTANTTTNINRGTGFVATDVGRAIRVYQDDGYWRAAVITAFTSSTVVTITLQGEPLYNTTPITRWRLGAWSDTTGYPTTGEFAYDRLTMGGAASNPTLVGMSSPQAYEVFSPTEPNGLVADDNAIVFQPNTRNASPLRWVVPDEKGILLGFGSSEWIIKPNTEQAPFSARNAKAVRTTERGSAAVLPVVVDDQVIFVHKSKRALRELAYVLTSDGFKAPSMSLFSTHIGVPKFAQLVYCAEPHSIIWVRREDGSLVGMTYNREENIVGWHVHDLAGGFVESIGSIVYNNLQQDALWLSVRRTINGVTKRYIERLTPFWDFGYVLSNSAHFVDCGLRATYATPQTVINNLSHLEGKNVVGLADGVDFGFDVPVVVTNGKATIPIPALKVVIGLAYTGSGETVDFEAGAADGSAGGKLKRAHNVSIGVWDTYGGDLGYNIEEGEVVNGEFGRSYVPIKSREDEITVPTLFTGVIGPLITDAGYGKRASVVWKSERPYPFNVTALYPQQDTQDR